MKTTIENAKLRGGVRGLVLTAGQNNYGFCASLEDAIAYDGNDLCVCLVFEQRQFALGFRNAMLELGQHELLKTGDAPCVFHVDGPFEVAGSIGIDFEVQVLNSGYVQGAFGSPLQLTLADVAALPSNTNQSTRADVDLQTYQSFEQSSPFVLMTSMHIIDSSQCKGNRASYDQHSSNRLAGYEMFHAMFDGRLTDPGAVCQNLVGVPLVKVCQHERKKT